MKIMNETLEMNQEQNVKSIEAVADVAGKEKFNDSDLYAFEVHEPKCKMKLHGAPPIIEKLWQNVLWEIEQNFSIETPYGTVFGAANRGKGFFAKLFTRDVSFSGILGLNVLYPKEMMQSMKIIRKVRLERGWSCPKDQVIQGIEGVTIEDLTNREYIIKYGKSTPANKTDDVIWLWSYYDLLTRGDYQRNEWEWYYETGLECFKRLYDPFYDPDDGLYFGQPTFIDVGHSGYPQEMMKQPLLDPSNTTYNFNACIWVKASSTNSLYYAGLLAMAGAAKRLNRMDEAADFSKRAAALADSMRKHLRFEDGTFTYFKHKGGHLEPRREAIGTALPVIFGIVDGEEAKAAVAKYPYTVCGAPTIYPFYDNNSFYHNNSAWPFASTIFNTAVEKATGSSTAFENLVMLMNSTERGAMREVFDMRKRIPTASFAQLWSMAAFVCTCSRMNYTSFKIDLNPFQ